MAGIQIVTPDDEFVNTIDGWYHIAIIRDGIVSKTYINGALENTDIIEWDL